MIQENHTSASTVSHSLPHLATSSMWPPPHLLCVYTHTSHRSILTTPMRRFPCNAFIIVFSGYYIEPNPKKGSSLWVNCLFIHACSFLWTNTLSYKMRKIIFNLMLIRFSCELINSLGKWLPPNLDLPIISHQSHVFISYILWSGKSSAIKYTSLSTI